MATTVIVGGITPDLKILGDTQRFLFEQPNGILRLENAITPVDSIPVNLDLDFLNINEKGYRLGFYSDSTDIKGMFHLSSLQYQQNQQNSGIVSTKLITFNENGLDKFLFYKNFDINNNKIINVPNPINNTDASNKAYVDNKVFDINTNTNGQLNINRLNGYPNSASSFLRGDGTWTLPYLNNLPINAQLNLSTYGLITTGDINAQTGTLKANNLSSYNSGGISVVSNLGMNNNSITGLPNPTNAQDATTKTYVDSTAGIGKSVFYGYVGSNYISNVSVGDHIKFDSNSFSRGSNIVLDGSSTYTTATNVASIGRITLLAGYTYKLMGSINNIVSANFNTTRWYNADTNSALGLASGVPSPISTTDRAPSAGTIAFFTPSVNTRVELRITFNAFTRVNGNEDSIGPAYFVIEQI
jgi:hypothetical protein